MRWVSDWGVRRPIATLLGWWGLLRDVISLFLSERGRNVVFVGFLSVFTDFPHLGGVISRAPLFSRWIYSLGLL